MASNRQRELVDIGGVKCLSENGKLRIQCSLDCEDSSYFFRSKCLCDYRDLDNPKLSKKEEKDHNTNILGDLISRNTIFKIDPEDVPGIDRIQRCIRDHSNDITRRIHCFTEMEKDTLRESSTSCTQYLPTYEIDPQFPSSEIMNVKENLNFLDLSPKSIVKPKCFGNGTRCRIYEDIHYWRKDLSYSSSSVTDLSLMIFSLVFLGVLILGGLLFYFYKKIRLNKRSEQPRKEFIMKCPETKEEESHEPRKELSENISVEIDEDGSQI